MAAFKKDQFSTRRLARNTLNILYVADYFYSFNPFISYTLFLLLCLINSFFGTFEKTQLQIEHFLEHLAKWHCVISPTEAIDLLFYLRAVCIKHLKLHIIILQRYAIQIASLGHF